MKQKITCLLLLGLLWAANGLAQGIPQHQMLNPNTPPYTNDTAFSSEGLRDCGGYTRQWGLEPIKFQPALPQQGTITDIYFRLPGNSYQNLWMHDTVLANSKLYGVRIKLAITNLDTLWSPDSCRRVNPATVFNTPVYTVPLALQGDDSTKCWLRLPLDAPFSYNLTAPLYENDTTTRRFLVVEILLDSNTISTHYYNPGNNPSSFFGLRYYAMRGALDWRTFREQKISSCFSNYSCSPGSASVPVMGFDFAPNSIKESSVPSQMGVYPNPVGSDGRLYFKQPLPGKHYKLYNMNGKVVAEGTTTATGIDMQALPAGVYLLYCGQERYKVVK